MRVFGSTAVLLLAIACCLLLACVEAEEVELAPDSVRARNDLLTACGQDRLTPVVPTDEELARIVEWWRDELGHSLDFDNATVNRLITVSGVTFIDAYLVIDAYYTLDWLYLPFRTETAILGSTNEDAVRQTLKEAIAEIGLGYLPSVTPIGLVQAIDQLEIECGIVLENSTCPPLFLVSGDLWFAPPRADGQDNPPALRLRDLTVCCSGLDAGCQ